MKRRFGYLLTLILMLCFVFVFTACGDKENNFDDGSNDNEQTQQPEEKPNYGEVSYRFEVKQALGAYSEVSAYANLYESGVAFIHVDADTTNVGQGVQTFEETGTWSYNSETENYSIKGENNKEYVTNVNAKGVVGFSYTFIMRGQTGGRQEITIRLALVSENQS